MSDLDKAIESGELKRVINGTDIAGIHPSLKLLCAAARRFLALTETGQRVEWCEPHEALANPTADYCGKSLYLSDVGVPDSKIGPCHIVPKFLADYLTSES